MLLEQFECVFVIDDYGVAVRDSVGAIKRDGSGMTFAPSVELNSVFGDGVFVGKHGKVYDPQGTESSSRISEVKMRNS